MGLSMKKSIAFACLCLVFAAPAFSGVQQEKMVSCNQDATAKALKGDERKAFMKGCLSKKVRVPLDKKAAQQNKMKDCNKTATGKALKGDARKKFMSACLKG
jgi:hypothetical protein